MNSPSGSGRAVFVDGAPVDPDGASIPIADRAVLYGESVFVTMRTYGGRAFEFERHAGALQLAARACDIPFPTTVGRLSAEVDHAIECSGPGERRVRIVVTGGAGEGLVPVDGAPGHRIITVAPLASLPVATYTDGVACVVVEVAAAAPLAPHKTGSYLPNVLLAREARRCGVHEALVVTSRGAVLEGATSNVFAIVDRALVTSADDGQIHAGVTRALVLDLAQRLGLDVRASGLSRSELWTADEVFITSTLRELVPVIGIDDHEVGTGMPGEVTRLLHREFRRAIPRAATAMPWDR